MTVVAIAVVVVAFALWKLRVVLALVLLGMTVSAAMRPGVELLAGLRVPRPVGVLAHYAAFLGVLAAFAWLVAPTLAVQVQHALDASRTAHAGESGGVKDQALAALARQLHRLSRPEQIFHPALTIGQEALKILVGILFTLAVAAYWIFERDRTIDLVAGFVPARRRRTLRDTWLLIELKLGAFVRGELVLIAFVSCLTAIAFFLVGEPYWLLVAVATGILEIVPVVGPLAAFLLVVGAGLTVSWHTAALAGGCLLAIRLLEDYAVTPRVLGGAVGLPPLLSLISVSVVGVLLGGFYVLLSIPIASIVSTVFEVVVRGADPAELEAPTVLLPSRTTR